jgi:antitoxin component YwqK of YwqJK toxin-antitoxin module
LTIIALAGWVAMCQDFLVMRYFIIASRGHWMFECADGRVIQGKDDLEQTEIKEFLLTSPSGKMTRKTKSGVIVETYTLLNGNKDGTLFNYDRSGCRLLVEENYTNGVLHGIQKSWWGNGSLRYHKNYQSGRADGIFTNWYEPGKISFIMPYVNGVLHGERFDYAPDGHLMAHCVVSNWMTINGTELLSDDGKGNLRFALYKDGKVVKEWAEKRK